MQKKNWHCYSGVPLVLTFNLVGAEGANLEIVSVFGLNTAYFLQSIFSDYNIESLVDDIDSMLVDLKTLNDVFAQEGDDLDNIFEKLQEVSEGNLSENEAGAVPLRGDSEDEIRQSNDWHIHHLFNSYFLLYTYTQL